MLVELRSRAQTKLLSFEQAIANRKGEAMEWSNMSEGDRLIVNRLAEAITAILAFPKYSTSARKYPITCFVCNYP